MDELKIRQVSLPIHTGIPPAEQSSPAQTEGTDFREILRRKMETGPTFSKHAASRAAERGIDLSRDSMEKLNEGMKLAEEKGLKEPLILVGGPH